MKTFSIKPVALIVLGLVFAISFMVIQINNAFATNGPRTNNGYPCEILEENPHLAYEGELETCRKHRKRQDKILYWTGGALAVAGVLWYLNSTSDDGLSLVDDTIASHLQSIQSSYDFDTGTVHLQYTIDF